MDALGVQVRLQLLAGTGCCVGGERDDGVDRSSLRCRPRRRGRRALCSIERRRPAGLLARRCSVWSQGCRGTACRGCEHSMLGHGGEGRLRRQEVEGVLKPPAAELGEQQPRPGVPIALPHHVGRLCAGAGGCVVRGVCIYAQGKNLVRRRKDVQAGALRTSSESLASHFATRIWACFWSRAVCDWM